MTYKVTTSVETTVSVETYLVVTEEARGLVRRVARKELNPWSTDGIYLFIYLFIMNQQSES